MRYAKRRPSPWSFHAAKYGLHNVVVDANQEPVAFNVPVGSGALVAAAPDLLKALETVAREGWLEPLHGIRPPRRSKLNEYLKRKALRVLSKR